MIYLVAPPFFSSIYSAEAEETSIPNSGPGPAGRVGPGSTAGNRGDGGSSAVVAAAAAVAVIVVASTLMPLHVATNAESLAAAREGTLERLLARVRMAVNAEGARP